MSEWRDIKSAPKDESPVDIWCGDYNERLCNYIRMKNSSGLVFYGPKSGQGGRCFVFNATHWMPLPEPPKS